MHKTKRNLLSLLLIALFAICTLFAFTACDNDNTAPQIQISSEGLVLVLITDGEGIYEEDTYGVAGFAKNANITNLVIPSTYQQKKSL